MAENDEPCKRAEKLAHEKTGQSPENLEALSAEEARRVRLIVLKMQNEELRRVQADLDAERARYFDLYNLAPVGYCTLSEQGLILEANLIASALLGVDQSALAAQPMTRFIYPEDQDIYFQHRTQVRETGAQRLCEIRMLKADGTIFWAHLQAALSQKAGYRITLSDVTERKRAEEALKRSEKFVKDILASMEESFLVVDREYRILTANGVYCAQAGKPLESIIGKYCYEISHQATRPCQDPQHGCAGRRTFETGEPTVTVHAHKDENGRRSQVEIKTFAMKDDSGNINSIIEVISDVTEKTALENQLRHAQKMEGIGTLAGGIAHDFNNIMTAIIGHGHVALMKMPQDGPQRLYIEHMLASADRAAALTQSLLAFSRKQVLDRKPVDLNEMLTRVEKFLARVIGEEVEIRKVLDPGVFVILADAGQLEQVFMNLATNARDAMPGGGSFTIETSMTELDNGFIATHGYGKAGIYAMISAIDTGEGMNEETRKKIFEPFFTTKEVGKGTGLGLAIVYGIIKQHDGFINVYSEPGKGTTFRIFLPLIKAEAVAELQAMDAAYSKGGSETILLAEDDQGVRKLTELVLEQMGYTVIIAHDGEEAVAKFFEHKDSIRLLLFDIVMPKKNGKEAYEEIRMVKPDIPVLFTSGYSRERLRQKKLLEHGAAMLFKPVAPQELLRSVREALDGKI